MFDPDGEPRVVVTRKDGRAVLHWRPPGGTEWKAVAEYDPLNAPFVPRYLDANRGLEAAQVWIDGRTGDITAPLLVLLSGFVVHRLTGAVTSR